MKAIMKFWGEYRWLSNFWPCRIWLDGEIYPSVEHAYQASKTLDSGERKKILRADTPGKAKKLGKTVSVRPDWDYIKLRVMADLVRQKFIESPELGRKLLETGDVLLVEGNLWNDRFWGVDLRAMKGSNHLGKILMEVREELRAV